MNRIQAGIDLESEEGTFTTLSNYLCIPHFYEQNDVLLHCVQPLSYSQDPQQSGG